MKIIVAPRNIHLQILSEIRRNDLFLDVKIYSKEDLKRYVYPSVNEETLLYLMKNKGYTYEVSRGYLQDICYVTNDSSNPKKHFLFELREELKKNELLHEPLDNDLRFDEVEIIGYPREDFELTHYLDYLNLKYKYIYNEDTKKTYDLYNFEKIEDEVYFVLNEIATLIDKGVSIKDIYLFRRNNIYDYYLNKFSSSFGYKLNIDSSESMYSTGGAKLFIKLYKENKDIDASLEELKNSMGDDPQYLDILDIVNDSRLEDVDSGLQLDYFINKFKESNIKTIKYDNAVNVISNGVHLTNKHIFVVGFAQGHYPKVFKDDHYLSDDELHSINRLNSKDKTKLDELILIDLFKSNNHFYFSFSKRNKEGECYLSPIEKRLSLVEHSPNISDTFYSEEVLKLMYTNLKDLDYFYREKKENFYKIRDVISIDYNSYSNEYTYRVNAYDENSKIELSTSSLDLFSRCPFQYYLEKVVRLDDFEESYALNLGNLAHDLFEHCREENFDFNGQFDEKVASLTLKPSEKYILTHNVKDQIREAIKAIKKREEYYTNPKFYNEYKLDYWLSDKTKITGRIDNLVTIDNEYIICIDYKTGSTKFDDAYIKDGLSTQLPTYALLTASDKKFKDYTLTGLYINNVLTKSIKVEQEDDELIPSYLKLNGKTLGNFDVIKKIDPTIIDGKSSFISGVATKKDGSLKDSSSLVSNLAFKEYEEIVKEQFIKMDKDLRNNNFPIRPYYVNDRQNGCEYCAYKDVCFMRNVQFKKLSKEENEDE